MEPILEIAALKKYYGKEPNLTRALDGISFQVMPGEFLGIMGSSGSGKSTLLNCIATVIAPSSGAVALHDKCITTLHGKALADYRSKEIGYLFQNFELIDNLTGVVTDPVTQNYITLTERVPGNDLTALLALAEGMRESRSIDPDPATAPTQPILFATGSEDAVKPGSLRLVDAALFKGATSSHQQAAVLVTELGLRVM